jgi:hypothetical protein
MDIKPAHQNGEADKNGSTIAQRRTKESGGAEEKAFRLHAGR